MKAELLLQKAHSSLLDEWQANKEALEDAQLWMDKNARSESTDVLVELMAVQNKIIRLEATVTRQENEIDKLKKECESFITTFKYAANAAMHVQPLQKAITALSALTPAEKVQGTDTVNHKLQVLLKEKEGRISSYDHLCSQYPEYADIIDDSVDGKKKNGKAKSNA